MTDAVSSIKLGIDTATGKKDLVELRAEFAGLRAEIEALSSLKANAQGLVGGAKTAQAELATLGAELKASASKVNELEQQLAKLSKSQASNAKAATDTVAAETKKQFDIQATNAKNVGEMVAAAEKKTTETVKQEAAKRAAISASGTYGGIKYSVSEKVDPGKAEENIIKAKLAEQARLFAELQDKRSLIEAESEAKHRALMFESVMNDAKTEQERLEIAKAAAESRLRFEKEIQQRRDALMAGAGQNATLAENAAAYKATLAEQNQEYQLYLQRQREYMLRHRDLEKTFAEADKEKQAQVLKEQNQQYQQHLLDQAAHLKEWNEIEAFIVKDKLLMEGQQYKEYQATVAAYRERQHDIEIAFQKAEEQEYKAHLQRQSEEAHKFNSQYNAERRATLLDARFDAAPLATKVSITRNAASLVGRGESGLAHETYGSEAVNSVSKLAQMEAELNATRKKGNEVVKEARAHAAAYKDGLGDVHAAVKGLTHGMDQMWLSWGSMVPMVAGFALAASMLKILAVGKEVEFQLQYLKIAGNELNREPLNLDKFIGITETSMESLHEAATAVRVLSQSGLNAKEALIALPDVLNFATLGEMSATQAATSLSSVMHTFGKEASNMGNIGDVIAKVATSTTTTSSKMIEAMRQASTAGSIFNLSLEQTAAALGVMAEKGIVGSQAGTALSTALKNLYEPTTKASQALAKMGVDTSDGHGGLKDVTTLVEDLRQKLSTLDDEGKTKFLGTITDSRAMKALAALTGGFGEYKKLLDGTKNSSDFMLQGTLQLEDTVEGAWRRMTNALEGGYMKAFTKAEPEIRAVQFRLAELAKSDDAVDLFTHLAVGAARVTETLVENGGTILKLVGAYMALRVISTITQGLISYRLNTALATAATAAKTAATVENTVATEVNILTMETQAAMALAAGRSLTMAGMAARGLSTLLGPIALAVTVAYTAYEIFTAKVNDSDLAMQKAGNTVNTTINYYQRQIEKLRELNEELRKNEKHGTDAERATARTILRTQLQNGMDEVKAAQKKVNKGPSYGDLMAAGAASDAGQVYQTGDQNALAAAEAKVAAAQKGLEELGNIGFEYKGLKKENQRLQDKQSLVNELKRLKEDAGGGDDTKDALRLLGTEKSRALMPEIQGLMDDIENGKIALKDAAPKLKDLHDKVNEAKGTFKPDVKDKAANDAYRAAQLKLDGDIQLHKDNEKSGLAGIKSKEKTGEIGDLEAITARYQVVKQAREDDLKDYIAKENLAASHENRKADEQGIKNKKDSNNRAEIEAKNEMGREIAELQAKWNQDSLKSDQETLVKKGLLVAAYEAQYKASHQAEISKLDKDIGDKTLPQNLRDAAGQRKGFLNRQYAAGHDEAGFSQDNGLAQEKLAEMQERLQAVADKSARTNESARSPGFLSDIGAAQAADDIRSQAIPAIEALIAEMAKLGGDPKSKSTIAKLSTDLIKEANRSRDAWIAAGKSIEKSLGDSFGKGGKAVGGIVSALIKQRETQKGIDDDLKRQKADPKNSDQLKQMDLENKAREQSAQLQISSYADITGAAKNLFDEHSKGYQVMEAAEKGYRLVESAMALSNFLLKQGFIEKDLIMYLFGSQAKAAADTADTGKVLIEEGAKQTAKGITAVANQAAGGDPITAWPRMAMMAAALAAIGIMIGGGGGSAPKEDVAKERQKYAGTGVAYSSDASKNPYDWELEKSDSLTKSLEKMRDNSDIALRFSSSQLSQLEHISQGISGLTSSLVQSTGIRGTKADENALGVGSDRSFLGFSSSSKSLTDSGISFRNTSSSSSSGWNQALIEMMGRQGIYQPSSSQSVGTILANGVQARSYADTHSESKSAWGLLGSSSSNDTTYGTLNASVTDNMTEVIKSMYTTVSEAAKFLGRDNSTLENAIKSVTLQDAGLDKLSLKGLSSDEVEKQLNAAFSSIGDLMAKKAMPALDLFKKGGEGYLNTLIRVSAGVEEAKYSLEKLGVAAVDYTKVLNKQGDVGTEIVRDSLVAKETATTTTSYTLKLLGGFWKNTMYVTAQATSGIGEIIKNMTGSADDLAQAYTKLNEVRQTMRVTGANNADVTTAMVRGAGGLDNLSSGVNDFLDKFFSEGEKAAAKTTLLQEQFSKIGKPMPKTIQEFKTMALAIDRSSEAGQTLYGQLMALAGQFGELADAAGIVNPAISKQKASITDLVKVAERWLSLSKSARDMVKDLDAALSKTGKVDSSQRIEDLRNLMSSGTSSFEQQLELAGELKDLVLEKYQTEKDNAKDLIDFSKDLTKYVKDLRTGDLSPLTNQGKLEEAFTAYKKTLADTGSDDTEVRDDARSDLQGKASTLLELARTYYTSSQSYTDIFDKVTGDLDDLGAKSKDSGQQMKDLSEAQVTELQNLRALAQSIQEQSQVEYNASLQQVATQIKLLDSMATNLGIMADIPSILRDLPAELSAQLSGSGVNGKGVNGTLSDEVEKLYETLLHRQANSYEMGGWMSALQRGVATLETVKDSVTKGDEYKRVNGSHAGGLDYVPFDGYVAELHHGERVLTASEARRTDKASMASTASFSAQERDQMSAEIAELRKVMERMIETQETIGGRIASAVHNAAQNTVDGIVSGTSDAVEKAVHNERSKPAYG